MVAIAAPAVVPNERAGYVDGYEAAIDAFSVVLRESAITLGEAMKRLEDHLLYRIDPWIDDLDDALLPVFDDEDRVPAHTSRRYRHGYMDGWDDAILAIAVLIDGYAATVETALARAGRHIDICLRAWRDHPERTGRPPQLEHLAPC